MHLNIPGTYHPTIQEFIRGIRWGVVGIFAPELVVFAAWRQYNSATALKALVQDRIAEAVTPCPSEQPSTKSSDVSISGFLFSLGHDFRSSDSKKS